MNEDSRSRRRLKNGGGAKHTRILGVATHSLITKPTPRKNRSIRHRFQKKRRKKKDGRQQLTSSLCAPSALDDSNSTAVPSLPVKVQSLIVAEVSNTARAPPVPVLWSTVQRVKVVSSRTRSFEHASPPRRPTRMAPKWSWKKTGGYRGDGDGRVGGGARLGRGRGSSNSSVGIRRGRAHRKRKHKTTTAAVFVIYPPPEDRKHRANQSCPNVKGRNLRKRGTYPTPMYGKRTQNAGSLPRSSETWCPRRST